MTTLRLLCLFVLLLLAHAALAAQTIRCPDTRDVWLSAANAEESQTNGGKATGIKLKVLQEFGLLDFDVSALGGKRITSAMLHVFPTGGGRAGEARGTDLRWFSVSTVSSDWVEGQGEQYALDEAGHGATFNEASYHVRPWTMPGSRCWDVILGNGNSLRCDVDGGDPRDGWFSIPLDVRLVQALACRASYGLALMDGSTGVDRNCTISSREGEHPPYLEVTVEDDATSPAAPSAVAVVPAPQDAGVKEGAVRISLRVPPKAFAFNVEVNGQVVPRWQIPFAGPAGGVQSFVLEYLPSGAPLQVRVSALDAAGHASPFIQARGQSSAALQVPALPELKPAAPIPAPLLDNRLKVWALPESCKVDALSGRIVLEPGMDEAETHNAVWNGGAIRIAAARGEIAACQLALQSMNGDINDVKVAIEGLDGITTRLWRAWFLKVNLNDDPNSAAWLPEYALPLAPNAALQIPARDNSVPGQKTAIVSLDFIVPPGIRPGAHSGAVVLTMNGKSLRLPLNVVVYPAIIPAQVSFNPELNCYGGPGEPGTDFFFDSFRLAHYYRCTINSVSYNHATHINPNWVPDIDASGHVTDWSRFDRNLGPLLDGSAFKDNPRSSVPVPVMYLPQSEQWPLLTAPHYHPDAPIEGPDWKALHDMQAKPPADAFDGPYQDAFAASIAEWARHFAEKGWTQTRMQCFFNRKYQFYPDKMTGTAWTMDEPSDYLDWQALLFYSRLFHRGLGDSGVADKVRFVFRGDISRPMWQGSLGDGSMEMIYANGDQFSMLPLMRALKRRAPATLVCYGSCNAPNRANHETVAWCLQSYVHECDGVVPWQSLGDDAAFDRGDPPDFGNALIVDGRKRFGLNAVASFRVQALRQGAQLNELLELLRRQKGWSRAHIGLLVGQSVPLGASWEPHFADDAAALHYRDLNGDKWVELKEGVLKLLQGNA